jgi:hypothetical protein
MPDLKLVDSIERPLKIYYDNEAALLYAYNNKKINSVKHINIKFYVVKEIIQDQIISLEHMSTNKIIMDPLMKGLVLSMFREHLTGMSLRESL